MGAFGFCLFPLPNLCSIYQKIWFLVTFMLNVLQKAKTSLFQKS